MKIPRLTLFALALFHACSFLARPAFAAPASILSPALQKYVDAGQMAGAVALVATPKEILSFDVVGWQDVGQRKPMRPDSVFWIASQTKPITATAVMMLVDERKVSVDDPVAKYLPEFADAWLRADSSGDQQTLKRPRRPMLVRDLLTHTSGLPFKSAIEEPTLDVLPLRTRVRSYAMLPLGTEPGEKFLYSNAGINTAGRIVEVVSGMPFEQFLDERVLQPLKMKDTTFWPTAEQNSRLAKAYRPKSGVLEEINIEQLHYPLGSRQTESFPAGGLFSTAQDLLNFYRMIQAGGIFEGNRLLSGASVKEMTAVQTPAGNRGFGFVVDANTYGHGGAYGTNSRFDRSAGLFEIYLVQQARWGNGGEKALPEWQQAAVETFGKAGK